MDWVRARSNEQIEQRINEIVDSTARLYEENRYEEITFAMIAKEANFTRSNLYRYFGTKEDIFLELIIHDIEHWQNQVINHFPDEYISAQEFSSQWVELFLEHNRMLKLFTILFTMLEQHASMEALINFKKKLMMMFGTITQKLMKVLPFTSDEAAAEFLSAQIALALGSYSTINPTPKQQEAMQAAGMAFHPEKAKDMLVNATGLLLHGFTENKS